MKGLEKAADFIVALVTGGPAAVWELIKEKLSDLKDTVIDGIKGFVESSIVKVAIPKLVAMFIPGAGFISAIVSIYGTIKSFMEQLGKIAAAVTAFIDSIVAIAEGQIAGAAKKVESALAGRHLDRDRLAGGVPRSRRHLRTRSWTWSRRSRPPSTRRWTRRSRGSSTRRRRRFAWLFG